MTAIKTSDWITVLLLIGIAEGIIGTYFPILFVFKGGSRYALGIVTGVIALTGLSQLYLGKLLDEKKIPKKILAGSVGLNIASIGAMGLSSSGTMYGSSRVSNNLGNNGINNANNFMKAIYVPGKNRGSYGNLLVGANLFGVMLGVNIAGVIYENKGYESAWVTHFLATIMLVLALVVIIIEFPYYNQDDIPIENQIEEDQLDINEVNFNNRDVIMFLRTNRGAFLFLTGYLIFTFGVGTSAPYFTLDLVERWHFSSQELTFFMTFNVLMQVIIIYLLVPIIDRLNRKKLFNLAIFMAITPVAFNASSPVLISSIMNPIAFWIISFSLSSIGWGVINAVLITLLIDYVPPKIRGRLIGIFATTQALLNFIAAIISGMLVNIGITTVTIFLISLFFRIAGFVFITVASEPIIPLYEFHNPRRTFLLRIRSTLESGSLPLPAYIRNRRKRHS
ncbi:MAG: MFS transporter [Candidatus Heimdallarchaeota archaeon]|nr:MFS transporter [Candidatus Heimdallarchaeota archaeon]